MSYNAAVIPSIPSIAALRAKPSAVGLQSPVVWVASFYGDGQDGGEGFFVYNPDSTAIEDGGVVIVPVDNPTTGRWIRDYFGKPVSAGWYGLRGGAVRLSGSHGVSITSGTNSIHSANYTFTSVDVGKVGCMLGAGAGGQLVQFKIASAAMGSATITNIDGTAFSASTTVVANSSPYVTSGTCVFGFDGQPAIQAAIDFCLYGNGNFDLAALTSIYIPPVVYVLSKTIQIGYGYAIGGLNVYTNPEIWADAVQFFAAGPALGGAYGFKLFADAPGFAGNGGRGQRMRNIGVMGMNYEWINANALGRIVPGIDDVLATNWVDPQLPASANSQYAPSCIVAIDPYAGTQPGTHYPNRTYPSWSGLSSQYNTAPSSKFVVENCEFIGDVVPFAVQPADIDANGDFITISQSTMGFSKTIYSAGNNQGRCLNMDSCNFVSAHTFIATDQNGQQLGKVNGTITSCDFGEIIRLISCPNSAYGGPLVIQGCSGEDMWQLGGWQFASVNSALAFNQTIFTFELQTAARGVPPYLIKSAAQGGEVSFNGVALVNFLGIQVFAGTPSGYSLKQLDIQARGSDDATKTRAMAATYNFTGGQLMFEPQQTAFQYVSAYRPTSFDGVTAGLFNLSTGTLDGPAQITETFSCQRDYGIPAWSRDSVPGNCPSAITYIPSRWSAVNVQAASGSVTGKNLTVDFSAFGWMTEQFALQGGSPGDVLYYPIQTTAFRVTNLTGTVVTAEIMSGYRTVSGVTTYWNTATGTFDKSVFDIISALWPLGNARVYSPLNYLQGDLDSSSTTVANVGNALGVGTLLDIANGDYVFRNNVIQADVLNANALISSVTPGSPGSFVLSADPPITQPRTVFQYFARTIPNE